MNSRPYNNPGINAFALSGPIYRAPRWRFRYTNWRGTEHEYVIDVEGVEAPRDFGTYTGEKATGDRVWVVHGDVVTRDGDPRKSVVTRRRTFKLDELRNLDVLT